MSFSRPGILQIEQCCEEVEMQVMQKISVSRFNVTVTNRKVWITL